MAETSGQAEKTVAILSLNRAAVGGVTRVAIGLAEGLPRHGWQPELFFPALLDGAVLGNWCAEAGVEWRQLGGLLPETSPRTWRDAVRLWKIVRREQVRVVNAHYGGAAISMKDALAIRLAGRRLVVTLHAPTPWSEIGEDRKRMTKFAQRLAHRIVVVSEAVADMVVDAGVPRARLDVIPGGVPIPEQPGDRGDCRDELGVPQDALLIASVARCAPEKRLPDLVNAVHNLAGRADGREIHVAINSDGGHGTEELRQLGTRLLGNRFHLYGPSEIQNHTLYSAADLFCLPSDLEGYPLALQEAASYSVPAVSTLVGGIPVLVEHNVTGLLCKPGDVAGLTSALERLAADDDLRLQMGRSARARAEREFSLDLMCLRYSRIL